MNRLRQWYRNLVTGYKNLKYRYKLTLLILVAGLVPVLIITVYMQYGMMHQLKKNEISNMEKTLNQSVETIENQAKIYENLVNYLSYSQDLRGILEPDESSDYETYLKYVNVADPLLQMPAIYHREIEGITLYSETIEVAHGAELRPLSDAQSQQWYSRLDDSSIMQWSVIRSGNPAIVASRKFYDSEDISAILAMKLDYAKVLEAFSSQLTENTGGIILDDEGNVVFASGSMDEKYRPEKPESLTYLQKNYTCSVSTMESTGWKFCMYRPTKIITESATRLALRNIPLVVISVGLLILFGYFFSKKMVSGLERLTENMNQIHLGFRKVTVSSDSNDEIGVLIRSFRRMMDQMNHLITEVYEGKIKLQNSEMKALQAQINPHFLYNSLSIINWKALEAGEDEISRVTLALSIYYRTSLNRGETMTTVSKEIDNIRSYLKIQLIMHDHEFQVVEEIAEGLEDYSTPKLILQPLVENAIEHGLDVSEKEEKILWITVRDEKESIFFEVRDNGVGMEQEKAEQILTYKSSGYGVRNVYERIHVLYGEKGEMKAESVPGEGTRVYIRIPKKAEMKNEK